MRVKSVLFDSPCRSSIPTNAQTHRRSRNHDIGPDWMGTYLMNIAIDVDRGLPS